MLHLYEIKVMNGDEGPHNGHVHEIPVVAPTFVEAVSHIEGFLKEHHPNDRIVGGGETVSNLFITKGAMEEMVRLFKEHANKTMENIHREMSRPYEARSSDFMPNGDPVEGEERIPQCVDPTVYEEPACPDVPGDGYQYEYPLEDA
jgi:hypothetical protein